MISADRTGELAVMTAPEAEPGFQAITGEDSRWMNRVGARIGLHVGTYRPVAKAAQVRCPLLICLCEKDSLVSTKATEKVADDAPQGRARPLPDRPLRHLQRRVVRARRVAPGGVPGAPPQRIFTVFVSFVVPRRSR